MTPPGFLSLRSFKFIEMESRFIDMIYSPGETHSVIAVMSVIPRTKSMSLKAPQRLWPSEKTGSGSQPARYPRPLK